MLHRKFRNHIQEIGKILRLRLSRLRSVVEPVERVDHPEYGTPAAPPARAPSQAPAPAWRSPSERYATRYR